MNKEETVEVRGDKKRALLATTLGFFFGFAAVALYGPTATYFKKSMGLSPSQLGFLVAIPALSGSLLRIPFGAWVDSSGGKKPFFILLLSALVGLGGLSLLLYFLYPDRLTISRLFLFWGF